MSAAISLRYTSWRQVAGYFDGDGSVIVRIRQFVLIFYLQWSDHNKPQLDQINDFIHETNQVSTRIYPIRTLDAFHLQVTRRDSVVKIAGKLLPFSFKKRRELEVVVDYYNNRITGNKAISMINEQVRKGFRSGEILKANLPYTHADGSRRARRRSKLSDEALEQIADEYREKRSSIAELALAYGKARSTIRKIVSS